MSSASVPDLDHESRTLAFKSANVVLFLDADVDLELDILCFFCFSAFSAVCVCWEFYRKVLLLCDACRCCVGVNVADRLLTRGNGSLMASRGVSVNLSGYSVSAKVLPKV